VTVTSTPNTAPRSDGSIGPVRGTVGFNLPLKSVMKILQDGQQTPWRKPIRFDYDKSQLKQAGIDLSQKVEFRVTNVSAVELFQKMFEPLGLDFTIRNRTVTLFPMTRK
jgi:hypothetical protein